MENGKCCFDNLLISRIYSTFDIKLPHRSPLSFRKSARIDIAMFNAALLYLYWYADPNPIVVPNVQLAHPRADCHDCSRLLAATFSISASATHIAPRTFISTSRADQINSPSLFSSRVKMAEFETTKSTDLPFSTSANVLRSHPSPRSVGRGARCYVLPAARLLRFVSDFGALAITSIHLRNIAWQIPTPARDWLP